MFTEERFNLITVWIECSDLFYMVSKDVPTGELPRNMLLSVDRHLVQTIVPGTRLTVMGIYSVFQASAA